MTFEFYRLRFCLRAIDLVRFRPGGAGNALRGGFGAALRASSSPAEWRRLFEPHGAAGQGVPSGLGDWPRPFVFRAAHLDGCRLEPGQSFYFDVHLFDTRQPPIELLENGVRLLAETGMGTGRARGELERVEQLDLTGRIQASEDIPGPPLVVSLDPEDAPVSTIGVRFASRTELKGHGATVEQPEFPILFGRLRDRLANLRALYGSGPILVDFAGMAERARSVRLEYCNLKWEKVHRRSARTGQVHPIGGFTGEAAYSGELREFLPWLEAGRWVGVGRQTVWGNGDIRVIRTDLGQREIRHGRQGTL